MLYELESLIRRYRGQATGAGVDWGELEVILDSPLAGRLTGLYRELSAIGTRRRGTMCTGGRVANYLKALLGLERGIEVVEL